MNEAEENEFHKVWDKLCDDGYRTAYEAARYCWNEAKRSQPSVVLPELQKDGFSPSYDANELNDKLTGAGIKYTIRE